MEFKGKFEEITESTLTRYQQGGLMVGDVVKLKKNILNHPKIKEMGDNVKGNIDMLSKTDLNLRVTAIKSTRQGLEGGNDGLGFGATTAPTDYWVDIAVEHTPGLTTDPVTLPIEVLERQDFGANLPSIPDSLKRKGDVNIKPKEVGAYDNQRGDKYELAKTNTRLKEDIEDIYSDMQQPKSVTVRVPLEDNDEIKDVLDNLGVTYSLIGPNRFELHGTMDNIQSALNSSSQTHAGGIVDIEYVGAENNPADPASQGVPTETGKPNTPIETEDKPEKKDDEANLEEAYARINSGKDRATIFTIEIPNAFADNIKTYLNQEGINNIATVNANKTMIDITTTSDKETVEENLKQNVMGDLTYLKVYKSNQQISES